MDILIICNWGKNRSGYLASYLKKKGYKTKFGGIYPESENPITQETVDQGNVLIFIQPQTKKDFLEKFKVSSQKIITLDVEDRVSVLMPDKEEWTDEEWLQFQKERVYPELEKQMEQYLPLG